MTEPKYCPLCGCYIPDQWNRCPACGHRSVTKISADTDIAEMDAVVDSWRGCGGMQVLDDLLRHGAISASEYAQTARDMMKYNPDTRRRICSFASKYQDKLDAYYLQKGGGN